MMGNVWEWNENLFGSNRGVRGGFYLYTYDYEMRSSERHFDNPNGELSYIGFRVASVPEPATRFLLGVGGMMLRQTKRRD